MLVSKIEYYWQGTLSELKLFVETNPLKLQGKWSSPGGEVKLFTASARGGSRASPISRVTDVLFAKK
jgi:hypothetical protein